MKIITLNTWGGRAGKQGLLDFFSKYSADTDIFCLQEIWSAPYEHLEGSDAGGKAIDHEEIMVYGLQEISDILPEFQAYFRPHHLDNYGLLMLVKKSIKVKEEGEVYVYKEKGYIPSGDVGNHARNIQYVKFEYNGKPFTVINFHGLWNGQGKTDSPDRITQSEKIVSFIQNINESLVLCGDFNLLPSTESLLMIEKAGYKNLIKEYNITSTRTSHYTKPEKYADYIFVSQDVEINDFMVLPEEVSDHSALLIDIK